MSFLPGDAPAHQPRDHTLEVARILDGCQPLAGTLAETYLQSRGLEDPASPDLLFHPDLTDFDTKRGWCGMVAVVRDGAGEPTGGIHRTFLLDDGSAKAPPGKKMLNAVAGGSVRLAALPEDGHLGIAEGIETALSARRFSVCRHGLPCRRMGCDAGSGRKASEGHDLRRCGRCGSTGSGRAGGAAQHREHRQSDRDAAAR